MPYLSFISDEEIHRAIWNVFQKYTDVYKAYDLKKFKKNQIDPFEMLFTTKLNARSADQWINLEAERQINKSISNTIGGFQEEILGCAPGFNRYAVGDPKAHSMDIMNDDHTIFADVKNKFNTVKGSDQPSLFAELENVLQLYPNGTAYYVQIIAKKSFDKVWEFTSRGKTYRNDKIRVISADKFYALCFGVPDAFKQLMSVLPKALDDFVIKNGTVASGGNMTLLGQMYSLQQNTEAKSLYDVIIEQTFCDYDGF